MKFTFTVQADHEEQSDLQTYIDAVSTACFNAEFEQHLRAITKYPPDDWSDQTYQVVEEIRSKWYELKESAKD